jgi:hypothetical protein
VPFPPLDASASDPSVPFERKISGRPCVGGNPGRAAHQRRKEIFVKRPTQPQAVRLCPALPRAFRARRASLRSYLRMEPTGPVQNGRGASERRFPFPLNRLFSSWFVVPTGIPPSRPCLPAFLVDASDRTSYI